MAGQAGGFAASQALFDRSGGLRDDTYDFTDVARRSDQLVIDADLALSHAQFTDGDPVGNRIPSVVETAGNVGIVAGQFVHRLPIESADPDFPRCLQPVRR